LSRLFLFSTYSLAEPVTVHAPTVFSILLSILGVNSNNFAHKMLQNKHFGARFSLLLHTLEQ